MTDKQIEEKKKVYTHKFSEPVSVISINKDGVTFSDGTTICDKHEQDCCEAVYAEWEALIEQVFSSSEYRELEIWGHGGLGIIINSFTVPCYNIQNGYYSSQLSLIITKQGVQTEVDISEFVEYIDG